ncbi:MAG: MoaD/ThiS family protein [Pseudomonadota bacterium]
MKSFQVLYFAWLRERIGLGRETVETDATTIADLVAELRRREARYDLAFSDMASVRAALDQDLVDDLNTPLGDAREVAFFPPMTGG